jgi:hypothetical protein
MAPKNAAARAHIGGKPSVKDACNNGQIANYVNHLLRAKLGLISQKTKLAKAIRMFSCWEGLSHPRR